MVVRPRRPIPRCRRPKRRSSARASVSPPRSAPSVRRSPTSPTGVNGSAAVPKRSWPARSRSASWLVGEPRAAPSGARPEVPLAQSSYDGAALDEPHQHDHDRSHQQEVNEPPEGVRADQAQGPQHEQQHSDCPQHVLASSISDRTLPRRAIPDRVPSAIAALTTHSPCQAANGRKRRLFAPCVRLSVTTSRPERYGRVTYIAAIGPSASQRAATGDGGLL